MCDSRRIVHVHPDVAALVSRCLTTARSALTRRFLHQHLSVTGQDTVILQSTSKVFNHCDLDTYIQRMSDIILEDFAVECQQHDPLWPVSDDAYQWLRQHAHWPATLLFTCMGHALRAIGDCIMYGNTFKGLSFNKQIIKWLYVSIHHPCICGTSYVVRIAAVCR